MEQSFWADGLKDEREIWENCLRTLKAIGNAQIVSYGAFETRFLKEMKARYALTPIDTEFVDHLISALASLASRWRWCAPDGASGVATDRLAWSVPAKGRPPCFACQPASPP